MRKAYTAVSAKQVLLSPQMFCAFGFGSGLSKIVPGTVGTLMSIPVYLLLVDFHWSVYLTVLILSTIIGIYFCEYATKELEVHDHPGIVWDEFVGFWLTMFLVPFSWQTLVIGFLLFRFFDMVKPWPISIADKRVHGGFGIMLDDLLAGLAALFCLQIYVRVW